MLRHNLILFLRNIKKYKSTFLINTIGLSSGLACVLLIYLWVNDELKVDKFHDKDSRLYQVMVNNEQLNEINTWNGTPANLPKALNEEVPEIEIAVGGTDPDWSMGFDLSVEDKKLKAIGKFAGNEYFKLFSYDLIDGQIDNALSENNSIVISESLAQKLFNTTEDVIGKTIDWKSLNIESPATITAIFSDPPTNSTDQFDFILPFGLYKYVYGEGWENPNSVTYVLLKEGTDLESVNAKLAGFMKTKVTDTKTSLFLAKYSDNYLFGRYENGRQSGGRIDYVRLFSIIALFILAIACINFMNLSTAKASRRIKEIGIKKAIGAAKNTLIVQYLGESVLLSFLSLFVAILIVILFLPQFNQLTGKQILLRYDTSHVMIALGIAFFTGIVSGSYPSLYLSKFKPATILKGKLNRSISEFWIRKGLVVFQFTLSVILIASVLVVYKQMQFVHNKNLGYEKDNILLFDREGKTVEGLDTFLLEVKNIPGIINASAITNDILNAPGVDFKWAGQTSENNFSRFIVHYDFIETLGVELKEGRSFSRDFSDKESQIVLNETAVDIMGFKEPIGKKAKVWGKDVQIVGVVNDFHYKSLYEKVGPMFFHLDSSYLTNIVVKIKAGKEKETIAKLEHFYSQFNPGYVLEYKFLDQSYQKLYESENKVAVLSRYFAGIAILISCLGLLGLAAFTAEKKRKEISVRKVLGQSSTQVMLLLSKEFAKLVLVAILIALPVAYVLTSNWLSSFAYKIPLHFWYFASAGLIVMLIAMLTVGIQAIQAANKNPIHALREE
ncbi:ABC transporter permease [Aquimarina sp. Aq78]|uniref:ABC transporter permease n=1 Tax=Aquimarina sp. Aq78 TaxID=1191889 RepID=UPI000D0FB454|nr:ABC transporter permease [Aquimarina sp. Aq78]